MNNPSHKAEPKASLQELLGAIPLVYQPIYRHPELSDKYSRICEDRLVPITQIYRALEAKAGQPLRVLDLGSAQGFFSFHLAELGATTYGVDFERVSVNFCTGLAAEFPHLKVNFQLGLVEEIIKNLQPGQIDLVLGLSVFHHIINRFGIAATRDLLTSLGQKTAAGIFEMALASEPMEWAANQPKNPRDLLEGYSFVHEIGSHKGYVQTTDRPLFVASNFLWFLDDQTEIITKVQKKSHARARASLEKTRRYFFSKDKFAKVFTYSGDESRAVNSKEFQNEIAFLKNSPPDMEIPKLLMSGQNENEAWLVRESMPGALLYDLVVAGEPYNAEGVLRDVLRQLAVLETKGLYHDDLRTWNILIAPDGSAKLIDYGAIVDGAAHTEWPYNPFLTFMILAHEILNPDKSRPFPLRASALNPDAFAEPYRAMFWKMFDMPVSEWRFAALRDMLARGSINTGAPTSTGLALALRAATEACADYQGQIQQLAQSIGQIKNI